MKKFVKLFSAAVLAAAFCSNVYADGLPGGSKLIFSTGGAQGTYYGFGGVLAGKVGENTALLLQLLLLAVQLQILRLCLTVMLS